MFGVPLDFSVCQSEIQAKSSIDTRCSKQHIKLHPVISCLKHSTDNLHYAIVYSNIFRLFPTDKDRFFHVIIDTAIQLHSHTHRPLLALLFIRIRFWCLWMVFFPLKMKQIFSYNIDLHTFPHSHFIRTHMRRQHQIVMWSASIWNANHGSISTCAIYFDYSPHLDHVSTYAW